MSDGGTPAPGSRAPGAAPGALPARSTHAWRSHAEALLSKPAPGPADTPTTLGDGAGRERAGGGGPVARRGPADPVKALLHRHRELCERAVDPLEIAAGLEAHGVTDRTAARFRHRDVFSLAEELYARVPRGDDGTRARSAASAPGADGPWSARTTLLALLPGAVGALTVAGLAVTDGPLWAAVGVAGALALAVALTAGRTAAGTHPAAGAHTAAGTRAWTGFLLLYALFGDGLLEQLVAGGPDGPWPVDAPPLLGLALAALPADGCARLYAARARRRLADSRGLADFAARSRPLLLGAVALYTTVLAGLLALVGAALGHGSVSGGALALGVLLFLARLLAVHGFPGGAAAGLLGACAVEALACASVLAARLPGCDRLARPVEAALAGWGPGAVPTLACGGAALALLAYATAVLARASAHADTTT
ncbi:hypothetical protein [Streptomyces ficellus]|uniref:Integral membrane protein n=1 Tax=Streptomyces ficellus TaxID=1977088 RepID=A0A6I6F6W9_9ACTN|nr:hypothetical protein [Streptomyces ficellus]QGV78701.1 hypothetical protein EIZ62_10940 [Streptomyces ficellus]